MLRITAKTDGFRRCGVAHSSQPTDHPAERFSKEEIDILKAEAMLTVVEIEEAPKPKATGGWTKEEIKEAANASVLAATEARPNAADTIAKVKEATSIEMLDELVKDEDRKSVQAAIEARRKELSA